MLLTPLLFEGSLVNVNDAIKMSWCWQLMCGWILTITAGQKQSQEQKVLIAKISSDCYATLWLTTCRLTIFPPHNSSHLSDRGALIRTAPILVLLQPQLYYIQLTFITNPHFWEKKNSTIWIKFIQEIPCDVLNVFKCHSLCLLERICAVEKRKTFNYFDWQKERLNKPGFINLYWIYWDKENQLEIIKSQASKPAG